MIEEFRKEIDSLDEELVSLFCRRLDLCKRIGKEKTKKCLVVADFARENDILCRLTARLDDEKAQAVQQLYSEIFKISKNLQQRSAQDKSVDFGEEK